MGMNISIDFGSTYTKIVYPDKHNRPHFYNYPNDIAGQPDIVTEISYTEIGNNKFCFVGSDAFKQINDSGFKALFCNFKMAMGLPSSNLKPCIPESKSEQEAEKLTLEYFDEILNGRYSFIKKNGEISKIAVTVPEKWRQELDNPGWERLIKVFLKLGLSKENICLLSEPICATAEYVYRHQQLDGEPREYNLLICDMGGATFDVCLCHVKEGAFIQALHSESGDRAGFAFDIDCVNSAGSADDGTPLNTRDASHWQRLLEQARIDPDNVRPTGRSHAPEFITREYAKDPDTMNTPVYLLDAVFEITVAQSWQAFEPIQNEIREVINRLHTICEQHAWHIDKVYITGGFSQDRLVHESIVQSLGEIDIIKEAITSSGKDSTHVTALGAFYIINDLVSASEFFPYELGLMTSGKKDALIQEIHCPIVRAHQVKIGMVSPWFAKKDDGNQMLVLKISSEQAGEIPVYIRDDLGNKRIVHSPGLEKWPPPGEYHAGFLIDRANCKMLILNNCTTHQEHIYQLFGMDPE